MITEDFVSFETARLLKEKGFTEEDCFSFYDKKGSIYLYQTFGDISDYDEDTCINAPTIQMTMKWLREKGWFICIIPLAFHCGEKACKFGCNIWADDNLEIDEFDTPAFYTYEDACEAAILYAIKNLT